MSSQKKHIAVVGSGISGLASAYFLSQKYEVSLFEANAKLGGHSNTVYVNVDEKNLAVDTGFLVFNDRTYPNFIELLRELDVNSFNTEMSFAVSLDYGDMEWAGSNLSTVFAQKKNLFNLSFLSMLKEILRFNKDAKLNYEESLSRKISLGQLIDEQKYSKTFQNQYLFPMAASIWSSDTDEILKFPASSFLRFCINHGLLQINNRPQWKTIEGGSREYVNKIVRDIDHVYLDCPVISVNRSTDGIEINSAQGVQHFDAIVFASHAPDTLKMLSDASEEEHALLSSVRYQKNKAYLHTDPSFLPKKKSIWSAWNYIGTKNQNSVCVSYWLNSLQNLNVDTPIIVTLNPIHQIATNHILQEFDYEHPLFDQAAIDAQERFTHLQGNKNTYFAGAWLGYGFHEDGLKSALRVAHQLDCMPSWGKL
jgi:predicted NAD/FAD-binding protein